MRAFGLELNCLPMAGKTLTHAEAARLVGVCRRTIYNWCAQGRIRERHYGRWKRVLTEDVESIIEAGFRSPLKRRHS